MSFSPCSAVLQSLSTGMESTACKARERQILVVQCVIILLHCGLSCRVNIYWNALDAIRNCRECSCRAMQLR